MAGVAGANELNDRQRFRGFYRTDATSEFVGAALAEIAREFSWTQMAIITRSESLFSMVCDEQHFMLSRMIGIPLCFADYREFGLHIQV